MELVVIHPHYTGRDKGAQYDASDRLLVFLGEDAAKRWLLRTMLERGGSEGNARYYVEHHVTYEPLAEYLEGLCRNVVAREMQSFYPRLTVVVGA
jgi:hypothetical protein